MNKMLQNKKILVSRVQQSLQANDLENAKCACKQICKLDKLDVDAHIMLGDINSRMGDHESAIRNLNKAIQLDKHHSGARFSLARVYMITQDYRSAAQHFEELLKVDDRNADAHHSLAVALRELGELSGAITCYERALQLAPDNPQILNNLGSALMSAGRGEEAIRQLGRAVEIRPDYFQAHFNRGKVFFSFKRWEEAIATFEIVLTMKPDSGLVHSYLGRALTGKGEARRALEHHETAVRLKADSATNHLDLSNALRALGDHVAAIQSARHAIALEDDNANAYVVLAAALHELGRYPEALEAYRQAISLKPEYAHAFHNMANTLLAADQPDDARACYSRALELDPTINVSYKNLAVLMTVNGELEAAAELLRGGINQLPDSALLHCELGKVYCELDRESEATVLMQRAVELDDAFSEAKYILAGLTKGLDTSANLEFVGSFFDKFADIFDYQLTQRLECNIPGALYALTTPLIQDKSRLDILDIGCGTGLCGILFRETARSLVGVDISARMIEKARERNIYDSLVVGDLEMTLGAHARDVDLVLAADVFVYVGSLTNIFAQCALALRAGGLFAFSAESVSGDHYVMRSTGRYGHSIAYLEGLAKKNGFIVEKRKEVVLRKECGTPITGNLYVLRLDAGVDQLQRQVR